MPLLEVVARYSQPRWLLLAISPIVGGVVAPLGGTLADRLGARWVALTGLAVIACGCLLFVTIDEHVSSLGYAARAAPIGLGMGLFNAANNTSVLNAVSRSSRLVARVPSRVRTLGSPSNRRTAFFPGGTRSAG